MNYYAINTAILNAQDIPKSVIRDRDFYEYLLDNGVAYYYCRYLSKEKNVLDEHIIAAANTLRTTFLNTLRSIYVVTKKNRLEFLLFKSYKYYDEIIDNDIDIFVRETDFEKFIDLLTKEGFFCRRDEKLKVHCTKYGFCKIEPRVRGSLRGRILISEKTIWQNKELVNIDGMKIFRTPKEIDLYYQLLNVLYNPNYLKLYTQLLYLNINRQRLYSLTSDERLIEDLKFIEKNLIESENNKSFPKFVDPMKFIIWWYQRILTTSDISLNKKFTLMVNFFLIRYSYAFFHTLAFKRQWQY